MTTKLIKAGFAALALLVTSIAAQGADIPIKGIRSVIAYYNWTGFYAGVNAGYAFGSSDWSLGPVTDIKPKGMQIGGTLGYNWQAGSIVYGIEGDFDWSGVKGSAACGPGLAVSCETANPWLATIRGRLGYAFDRWLPYITGGGAYGNIKATASVPGFQASNNANQFGWTFGAGLEYAFLGNWTAKIEYLYVDLGSVNLGTAPVVNNVSLKENIVRAGLNYKFSGPIFSRY